MEKETEQYLIKRIKDLENELAYLKAKENGKPFKREDFKDTCTKEYLSQALDNHFLKEIGINPADLVAKGIVFDKLQEILNLAVCHWVERGTYELYTTKPNIKKQINIEIDKETFKQLQGVFNGK